MAERRQDLEALEVNLPFNYLTNMVMPTLFVQQKAGTLDFNDLEADAAAETGRTLGVAPIDTVIAPGSLTFNATEKIKRYLIPTSQIKILGGLPNAEMIGTKAAKRSVWRKTEDDVATSLFSGAGTSVDIQDSLLAAVEDAIDSVHRVNGRIALVASWKLFRRITRLQEIQDRMIYTGIAAAPGVVVRGIKAEILAEVLSVEMVLVGDDDHWNPAGFEESVLVMALPEPGQETHLTDVQSGRLVQYQIDDEETTIMIETFEDDQKKAPTVDALTWYSPEILNASGIVELKGIDEGNVVTTTT